MPPDPVAAFLELARSNRLLSPEALGQVAEALNGPDGGRLEVFRELVERGHLTEYQRVRALDGRADELVFAGYAVLDERGPCPGGQAFRAVSTVSGAPVELRKFRREAFASHGERDEFVRGAEAARAVRHESVLGVIEAGVGPTGEAYVVLEAFDGADLATLVRDIGAMPPALAQTYGLAAARALQAVHAQSLVHGVVRPQHFRVGPLTRMSRPRPDGSPRFRPVPSATVKLTELGTTLPGTSGARADGDLVGLGATLHHLLTGHDPEPTTSAASLRPLPPGVSGPLARLTHRLLDPDASARPSLDEAIRVLGVAEGPAPGGTSGMHPLALLVDAALASQSGVLKVPDASVPDPLTASTTEGKAVEAQPVELTTRLDSVEQADDGNQGWSAMPIGDEPDNDPDDDPLAPEPVSPAAEGWTPTGGAPSERSAVVSPGTPWGWIGVGAGLWVLAFLIWGVYYFRPFSGEATVPTAKKSR